MNKSELFEELYNSPKTLVHFTAEWCQPCKRMQPSIDMIMLDHPEIKYVRVDVDDEADLASSFDIRSVPTLHFYNGADLVKENTGAMPMPQLKKFLDV